MRHLGSAYKTLFCAGGISPEGAQRPEGVPNDRYQRSLRRLRTGISLLAFVLAAVTGEFLASLVFRVPPPWETAVALLDAWCFGFLAAVLVVIPGAGRRSSHGRD